MTSQRIKIPLWLGNLIEVLGTLLGICFLLLSLSFHSIGKFFLLLISWIFLWYFTHCLAHYIVGRLFGIEFLYYYIGKSAILKLKIPIFEPFKFVPVLGLKIKTESLKRISKKKVAIFYSSGALSSMFLPAITLFFADSAFLFLLFLTIFNIFFTFIFSFKVGDLMKAIRALNFSVCATFNNRLRWKRYARP